jgi:hypothetical protein
MLAKHSFPHVGMIGGKEGGQQLCQRKIYHFSLMPGEKWTDSDS